MKLCIIVVILLFKSSLKELRLPAYGVVKKFYVVECKKQKYCLTSPQRWSLFVSEKQNKILVIILKSIFFCYFSCVKKSKKGKVIFSACFFLPAVRQVRSFLEFILNNVTLSLPALSEAEGLFQG